MSDKPILFSGAMVRAILDGRKTQTRRLLKLPTKAYSGGPIYERKDMGGWEPTTIGGSGCFSIGKSGERIPEPEMVGIWHRTCGVSLAAKWQAGDRLWVKETLAARPMPNILTGEPTNAIVTAYAADDADVVESAGFNLVPWWRGGEDKRHSLPSIFMPRWASRITLDVKAVRVERLQDISEADAMAEGAWKPMRICEDDDCSYRAGFEAVWTDINGAGSWDANPWVVAIEFQRVKP